MRKAKGERRKAGSLSGMANSLGVVLSFQCVYRVVNADNPGRTDFRSVFQSVFQSVGTRNAKTIPKTVAPCGHAPALI